MAALTGGTPKATYKDLLQVSNSNSGVDATLRDVEDGEGTVSALQVSTTAANVNGGLSADAIDNTPIGGTTPASGDFTTLDTTGKITSLGGVESNPATGSNDFINYGYTGIPEFLGRRSQGSKAVPTAITGSQSLVRIKAEGYDGSGFELGGYISLQTIENWSGSARGTAAFFSTTPAGSTSNGLALQLTSEGVGQFYNGIQLQSGQSLFDQYDEAGSWTPDMEGAGTAGAPVGTFAGTYTRTGDIYFVDATITLTSKGGMVGVLRVIGLPGTVNATRDTPLGALNITAGGSLTAGDVVGSTAIAGTTKMKLTMNDSTTVTGDLLDTDVLDTFAFTLQGSYRA